MVRALAVTAGIFALTASAGALQVIELPQGLDPRMVVLTSGAQGVVPAPVVPAADAPPVESERLKRLKELKFDRRPSAKLDTWSTPPSEPVPWPELLPEPAEATPEEAAPEETPEESTEEASEETAETTETPEETPEDIAAEAEAQAAAAQAEAERVAAEAAAAAEHKEAEAKALAAELELFQRRVTLGEWTAIKDYLAGLEENEARAGYEQLLASLVKGPPKPRSPLARYAESNYFAPLDITGLTEAAPFDLEDKELAQLGELLKQCVASGSLIERCIELLRAAATDEASEIEAPDVARMLMAAGHSIEAGEFLPAPEEAIDAEDRAALNLLARHFLAMHGEDEKGGYLEQAWHVTQAVLAHVESEAESEDDSEAETDEETEETEETTETPEEKKAREEAEKEAEEEAEKQKKESEAQKKEALERAVDIAPKIREELGQTWLDESFTARPRRGMEILSVIGSAAANGLFSKAHDTERRFKSLELQTTATEALLAAAPELATEWRHTLDLLASNWIGEADFARQHDTSTSRGPNLQRDMYGNFFYYNYSYNSRNRTNPNIPKSITTDEVLEVRPGDTWLDLVDAGLRYRAEMITAQLLLKVNEEDEAFPYIERLALTHPELAGDLVEEFLRVWARNHNPNTSKSRTNRYVYFYGYEQRADAIPLTRSKQERNLAELSEWVARLRELPIEDIDEELIAQAFTAAHSAAEVYRIETIEQVFGALDQLEPKTLAELVQKMRSNLVGVWRQPNLQKENKTRRRQKDIQAEVLRGYEVARGVVDRALADQPDDWALLLARASVMHDENNYRKELAKSSEFAGKRGEAFAEFERAAASYLAQLDELTEEEEDAKCFLTWFYASLGACDLNAIDEEMQPVAAQIELIRAAIDALPEEAAERHLAMFANTLFTRMSSVNPAVKFRYVRSGLEIVGDHERAKEAQDVYEYYRDLVTEIRLDARIDGSDQVGQGEFGLFVDIRHTREIEREAGGFSKYLVNQNNQRYSFNYGRPTEDYRDKFEEAAREALSEHFEVLTCTFNHPDTHSHAVEEYGWRVTPYAYLLIKARGPEVDRVPTLRLDLDFLDTSGYAVLPVESPPVAIDASQEPVERPFSDLTLVQTLDERQAKDGKLLLEVQASALGLVPDLDTLVDLAPDGFDILSTDDQGVSVSKFDEEGEETAVVSQRTWMISMQAEEDLEALPETFTFGEPRVEGAETEYQRYVDADLESVERIVSLEARYGERDNTTLLAWGFGLILALGAGVFGFRRMRGARGPAGPAGLFRMPENVSAFTVIGLLRDIEARNGVTDAERRELHEHIEHLEGYYFQDGERESPDLEGIAQTWLRRVS